jgi:CRP/FNR family transcriptional regulator, cyclic AMP receptor protein
LAGKNSNSMFVQFVQQLLTTPRLREGVAWVRRRVAAGEILTSEGVQGCSLFVVERGLLSVTGRVQLADHTTNEVTMAKLTEGNVFGESSLIGDYPSIATVRALTDSDVIEINGAMLSVYLDDNPHEGYLFFKYLLAVALDNLAKANRGIAIEPAVVPMKNGPQRPPI